MRTKLIAKSLKGWVPWPSFAAAQLVFSGWEAGAAGQATVLYNIAKKKMHSIKTRSVLYPTLNTNNFNNNCRFYSEREFLHMSILFRLSLKVLKLYVTNGGCLWPLPT